MFRGGLIASRAAKAAGFRRGSFRHAWEVSKGAGREIAAIPRGIVGTAKDLAYAVKHPIKATKNAFTSQGRPKKYAGWNTDPRLNPPIKGLSNSKPSQGVLRGKKLTGGNVLNPSGKYSITSPAGVAALATADYMAGAPITRTVGGILDASYRKTTGLPPAEDVYRGPVSTDNQSGVPNDGAGSGGDESSEPSAPTLGPWVRDEGGYGKGTYDLPGDVGRHWASDPTKIDDTEDEEKRLREQEESLQECMPMMSDYNSKEEDDVEEKGEYDYEGDMAKSQLRSIGYNAKMLHDMLEDNTNLPEWVQSKITLAEDYILTAANYMRSEMNMNEEAKQINEGRFRRSMQGYRVLGGYGYGNKVRYQSSGERSREINVGLDDKQEKENALRAAEADDKDLPFDPNATRPEMPAGKQPAEYRYVRNLARKAMKAKIMSMQQPQTADELVDQHNALHQTVSEETEQLDELKVPAGGMLFGKKITDITRSVPKDKKIIGGRIVPPGKPPKPPVASSAIPEPMPGKPAPSQKNPKDMTAAEYQEFHKNRSANRKAVDQISRNLKTGGPIGPSKRVLQNPYAGLDELDEAAETSMTYEKGVYKSDRTRPSGVTTGNMKTNPGLVQQKRNKILGAVYNTNKQNPYTNLSRQQTNAGNEALANELLGFEIAKGEKVKGREQILGRLTPPQPTPVDTNDLVNREALPSPADYNTPEPVAPGHGRHQAKVEKARKNAAAQLREEETAQKTENESPFVDAASKFLTRTSARLVYGDKND
jgi:hypothetical protein